MITNLLYLRNAIRQMLGDLNKDLALAVLSRLLMSLGLAFLIRLVDFYAVFGQGPLAVGQVLALMTVAGTASKFMFDIAKQHVSLRAMQAYAGAITGCSYYALAQIDEYSVAIGLLLIVGSFCIGLMNCAQLETVFVIAPAARRSEFIAMCASATPVAIGLGALGTDYVLRLALPPLEQYGLLLHFAAAAAALNVICVLFTRKVLVAPKPDPDSAPAQSNHRRLTRYAVIYFAFSLGVITVFSSNFLTIVASENGIRDLASYYLTLGVLIVGFRFGYRWLGSILEDSSFLIIAALGLVSYAVGLAFLPVHKSLILLAVTLAFYQAFMMPSLISKGHNIIENKYLKSGTGLILMLIDLGRLVGAPVLGYFLSTNSPASLSYILIGMSVLVVILAGLLKMLSTKRLVSSKSPRFVMESAAPAAK